MVMSGDHVWVGIPGSSPPDTPYAIMQKYAALLGPRTHGLLLGENQFLIMPNSEVTLEDRIWVTFIVKAPALRNYTIPILEVNYLIRKPYPVELRRWPQYPDWKRSPPYIQEQLPPPEEWEIGNQPAPIAFERYLQNILESREVVGMIRTLMAEINAQRA